MAKRTINQHLNDIERVFQHGRTRGVSKRKSTEAEKAAHTFSNNTTYNYVEQTKMFAKWAYEHYGVTDARFYKPHMGQAYVDHLIQRFEAGEIAPGTLKDYIHAVGKYQEMLHDQFGARRRIIDVDASIRLANEHGAVRRYQEAEKGLIISHSDATHMITALSKSRSINAETMSKIARFQLYTGSRITAALRFQVKDADFEHNTVTFVNDKGGKTRTVSVDPTYMEHLKTLVEGKNGGRQVFEMKNQNGSLKGIKSARKAIEGVYARNAAKLGLEGSNTHSQRKAFANDRYADYRAMDEKDARAELAQRAKESPQLAGKLRKMGGIYGANKMTTRNVGRMLTSIDLGHERLDALRWYLTSQK